MGSSSLDELTKQKLAAEVSESIASKMRTDAETAKLVAEARNLQLQNAVLAKEQQKTRLPWSTTEFTVVLGLLGFIAGSAEFAWTAWQNRIAAREALTANEAKEWRSAVASVDYLGEAKSVGGALTLATYYEDPAHARDARSLVASILPTIKNNDEFDHVFNGLYRNTRWVDDDDPQIYTVAKAVAIEYGQLADGFPLYRDSSMPIAAQERFQTELSTLMQSGKPPAEAADIKAARHREWEIDTLTHGLVDFWAKHGTRPPGANANYQADLETMILRFDNDGPVDLSEADFSKAFFKGAYLHNVDFTGANLRGARLIDVNLGRARLAGAHLDDADITGANLGCVVDFLGSTWDRVEWWRASRMSSSLSTYLSRIRALPPDVKVPAKESGCPASQAYR